MSLLSGKVALLTGGTQGIGLATASLLASKGCRIVFNYRSNTAAAGNLVRELGSDTAFGIQVDASSLPAAAHIVDRTIERYGKIDFLICCAASFGLSELVDLSETAYDQMMAKNVKGPLFLVQASVAHDVRLVLDSQSLTVAKKAIPYMQPGSRVVLFPTTQCRASTVTLPYLLYNMTKDAIEQMTRVLAKDLGRRNIFVNAIAPGPTATPMFLTGKSPEMLNTIASFSPANRFGQPEEVAQAVAFFCEITWVNGQVLKVNGGMA